MTRRRRMLALLVMLPLAGCIDGPFAHVNPHDPATALSLRILGGADTVRVVGDFVLFQAVTDPVTNGVTVFWGSSEPNRLNSLGSGLFQVVTLPVTPVTVQVRATLGGATASRDVVVMPAGAP